MIKMNEEDRKRKMEEDIRYPVVPAKYVTIWGEIPLVASLQQNNTSSKRLEWRK